MDLLVLSVLQIFDFLVGLKQLICRMDKTGHFRVDFN